MLAHPRKGLILNRTRIILLILLLGGGAFLLKSCFTSDEARIRAQLDQLAKQVSFPAEESQLQAAARAKRLSELFADEVTVDIRAGGKSLRQSGDRKAIMQAALGLSSRTQSLDASLHDISIRLADDQLSAEAEATGRAKIAEQEGSVVESFVFYFIKTEEGWLIERVANTPTFR